jgi:hypothetical protein
MIIGRENPIELLDGTKKGIGIMQVNKKNADLGLHKYIQ